LAGRITSRSRRLTAVLSFPGPSLFLGLGLHAFWVLLDISVSDNLLPAARLRLVPSNRVADVLRRRCTAGLLPLRTEAGPPCFASFFGLFVRCTHIGLTFLHILTVIRRLRGHCIDTLYCSPFPVLMETGWGVSGFFVVEGPRPMRARPLFRVRFPPLSLFAIGTATSLHTSWYAACGTLESTRFRRPFPSAPLTRVCLVRFFFSA